MDPFIQSLIALPILGYALSGRYKLLAAVDGLVLLVVVVVMVRRRVRADAAGNAGASSDACKWRDPWDAGVFRHHISLFLRLRGWRVLSAQAPGRIAVVAQMGPCRLAMLCLGPELLGLGWQ